MAERHSGEPARALAAEALGTAFLLAGVVGSGVMGERLADGSVGLALLGNMLGTAGLLSVLIMMFGPISGAHFNPAVSVAMVLDKRLSWGMAGLYSAAQILGGIAGVLAAHLMFDLTPVSLSTTVRDGAGQIWAEVIAAFGLVAAILATVRTAPAAVPYAVGLYIASAYWFTASTSFANPAVTIARSLTDTFSGIAPAFVPGFVAAQLAGAVAAVWVIRWLYAESRAAT